MTASYTNDGDDLPRVRSGSVGLTSVASLGGVGNGNLQVNDTPGTQVIVGQKDFAADEDDCSNPITFRGFVSERQYHRGKEAAGAGREIEVSLEDLNAAISFRGITGSDRKRPSETVAARGAWLMASDYVTGLFVDNGRCDFSSDVTMDAADYTDQTPGDVLADMALAQGGVNYYVREFDFYVGPELVFRDDNASTDDTSTIHISNVPGEEDGDTIFYPSKDFALVRRPERVKSKLSYQYAKGGVVEERAATATAYNGERFGVASNSNVKTSAEARVQAVAQLWQLHTEEDVIEGTILVPTTHVNLLNQGDRVGVRLEHFQNLGGPGITTYYNASSWIYCRVLDITKKPKLKPADLYELSMHLSPQEEAAPNPNLCGPLTRTANGSYWPLGGFSSTANPSDGVVQYFRSGLPNPVYPIVGEVGMWHFPIFGASGEGTIDYMGAGGNANALLFCVVGDGTAVVQTEIWAGTPLNYTVRYAAGLNASVVLGGGTTLGTFASGTSFEVTIDDSGATEATCVHWILMTPALPFNSGKIGWSQMTWTRA